MDDLQKKKSKKEQKHDDAVDEYDIPSVRLFREKLLESSQIEKPITDVYDVFDNDLARDNMENDLTEPEIDAMKNLWP